MKFINGSIATGAETWIMIQVPNDQLEQLNNLNSLITSDKVKELEIKAYKENRSLDANAALWLLLSKIAVKVGATKEELYLESLKRYGTFTHVIVKESAVDKFTRTWRTVVNLGEVTVNGKTGVQLQCYFGSSTYNKEEFSILLNGVISDAKELGIEFISKEEAARLIMEWDN